MLPCQYFIVVRMTFSVHTSTVISMVSSNVTVHLVYLLGRTSRKSSLFPFCAMRIGVRTSIFGNITFQPDQANDNVRNI